MKITGSLVPCLTLIWGWMALSGCPVSELMAGPDLAHEHRLPYRLDREPRTEEMLKNHLKQFMSDPDNPTLLLEIGIDYLSLATPQHWEYLDYAMTYLEKARNAFPQEPLLLMYLGRTTGARALNLEPSTLKRFKWAREGFVYMDQAVKMDAECFYLRLMRGEAALMAHPILRRGNKLDEDAEFVNRFTRTEEYETLPDFQKARIQLFLGNYSHKRKKPMPVFRDHWEKALRLAENTPFAAEARARLEGNFESLGYNGNGGMH